jgi:hypothetical protein
VFSFLMRRAERQRELLDAIPITAYQAGKGLESVYWRVI